MLIPLLSHADFKSHFRMTKTTFEALLKQLMIVIWTLATPDSNRSICECFRVGESTGLYIIRLVVRALTRIWSSIIKWPSDEQALETAIYFQQKYSFPGVIGIIDGIHVKIDAPHDDPEAYINRKGYYSIHLQVVCQQNLKFIDCFVGYPGSVHDNRVFQLSGMQTTCNTERYFPNNTHLLGDATYTNQKHLLVPFKNNGQLTERDENYNTRLSSAQMIVERSVGLLKGRFCILLNRLPVKRLDLVLSYIIACCVLHNFCFLTRITSKFPYL